MRKGTKKSTRCRQLDYSPLGNEPPEAPVCKLGHSTAKGCRNYNECPDYKYSWMISFEQVKENLMLSEVSDDKEMP